MTASGRALLVASLLLGAAAWSLDYPELLVCGLSSLLGLAAAGLWWLLPLNVQVDRQFEADRVVEGGTLRGTLVVTNNNRRRRTPRLTVVEAVNGERVAKAVGPISAGGYATETYEVPARAWGRLRFEPVRAQCTDPLGLFRTSRSSGRELELLVHPKIYDVVPLEIPGTADLEGSAPDVAATAGAELHSLREYVVGDDPRLVDWRATARVNRKMVRLNLVPKLPRGVVVLDTVPTAYDAGAFEDAVRVVASLADAALRRGRPIDIRTTTQGRFRSQHSAAAKGQMLDFLARLEASPGKWDFDVTPPGPGAVLAAVTGYRENSTAMFAPASARFSVVCLIRVGAPRDEVSAAPGLQVVDVVNAAGFGEVWQAVVGNRPQFQAIPRPVPGQFQVGP